MKTLKFSIDWIALLLVLFFFGGLSCSSEESNGSYVCAGKSYQIATITNVTPVSITLLFEGGGGRTVSRQELTEPLRSKFPLDPAAAEEYQKHKNLEKGLQKLRDVQEGKAGFLHKLQETSTAILRKRKATEDLVRGKEEQMAALNSRIRDLWAESQERPSSPERRQHIAAVKYRGQLEDEIGYLQKQIEALNKQSEEINKQMETVNQQIEGHRKELDIRKGEEQSAQVSTPNHSFTAKP